MHLAMPRRLLPLLLLLPALLAACGANDEEPSPTPSPERSPSTATPSPTSENPGYQVTVESADGERSETVSVELAVTDMERQIGLSRRQHLPEDAGMLFIYDAPFGGGFWMKDTYVPLDIAYLGRDGVIQEIREGVPLSEEGLTPAESYWFVLEVNQGWFEAHGFGPGDRVQIPDGVLDN